MVYLLCLRVCLCLHLFCMRFLLCFSCAGANKCGCTRQLQLSVADLTSLLNADLLNMVFLLFKLRFAHEQTVSLKSRCTCPSLLIRLRFTCEQSASAKSRCTLSTIVRVMMLRSILMFVDLCMSEEPIFFLITVRRTFFITTIVGSARTVSSRHERL